MSFALSPAQAAACAPRRRCRRSCHGASVTASAAPPADVAALFPPLKLGSLRLQSAAILSPMESVSDVAYRQLCYANGAAFTWCGAQASACRPCAAQADAAGW